MKSTQEYRKSWRFKIFNFQLWQPFCLMEWNDFSSRQHFREVSQGPVWGRKFSPGGYCVSALCLAKVVGNLAK